MSFFSLQVVVVGGVVVMMDFCTGFFCTLRKKNLFFNFF